MPQPDTTARPLSRQPSWLTILRVVLGLLLIWKGVIFTQDTAQLTNMIEQSGIGVFSKSSGTIAAIITILTLLCGLFVLVGFYTRISSIIQIPIIILALIFINLKEIERNNFELSLTIAALVLLPLFAIIGGGPLSADEYFRRGAAFDKRRSGTR